MAGTVTTTPAEHMAPHRNLSNTLQMAGVHLMRYGLVLVVAWIGAMKFTAYEATAFSPWWPTVPSWAGCITS